MSVAAAPDRRPHAPEGGWARRLLGPLHVTGVFWYRLHKFGVSVLPQWTIPVSITLFTTFFFVTLRRIRAAVAANLVPVLGETGWLGRQARIYRTFWSFAWCLSERYERLSTDHPFTVMLEGGEHWRQVSEAPQGFVILTAHLGNWEAGSMLPAAEAARRVHVVREAEGDPRAQEFIRGLIEKQAGSLYVTHFADDDPQLGLLLLESLRAGEIVALQGDRPRAGGRMVEVPLFGRPFPLPVGPAALARAAGVPLVPVFVFRDRRRTFRCAVRPPIEVPRTADKGADIALATRRFAAELEAAIRSHPHQWFCFRKLWE
jgi:lauroyl/myristoyl acyltransferase